MSEKAISKLIRVTGLLLTLGALLYVVGSNIYAYLLIEELKAQTFEEYFFVIDIFQLSVAFFNPCRPNNV